MVMNEYCFLIFETKSSIKVSYKIKFDVLILQVYFYISDIYYLNNDKE